jgi:rhodanese-related sulfurtransferase
VYQDFQMVMAGEDCGINYFPCIGHSLHLVVGPYKTKGQKQKSCNENQEQEHEDNVNMGCLFPLLAHMQWTIFYLRLPRTLRLTVDGGRSGFSIYPVTRCFVGGTTIALPLLNFNMRFSRRLIPVVTLMNASRSISGLIVLDPTKAMIANRKTITSVHNTAVLGSPERMTPSFFSRSSSSRDSSLSAMKNIGWEEMDSILDDYEELGREGSGMLVMDVRNEDEVAYTGQLSPNTKTLPLPLIMQANVFALEEDEFEELCGFPKPSPEETLVFSCAAGIRSVHAAKMAAQAGYTRLINYTGGANEWFTR